MNWCAWASDGSILCQRSSATESPPQGFQKGKHVRSGGVLFRPVGDHLNGNGHAAGNGHRPRKLKPGRSTSNRANANGNGKDGRTGQLDLARELERMQAQLTDERLHELAEATGVPAGSWRPLQPGWASAADLRRLRASGAGWSENPPNGAWAFAERRGDGKLCGFSLRAPDGRKGSPSRKIGASRGLVVPSDLHERQGTILVVEGASDVAAATALGLPAVGRPSNRGGSELVAELVEGRDIIVLGERDQKSDGSWPGRDGCRAVAERVAVAWDQQVSWALPPEGSKDIREHLSKLIEGGLDLADEEATRDANSNLRRALVASATPSKPQKKSQADLLVEMALDGYRLGLSDDGEPFAVRLDGPNIALSLKGNGDGLRQTLSRDFRRLTSKTPSGSALTDAICTLQGECQEKQREPVALRVAEHDGGLVVDLGDDAGRAVVITQDGWHVVEDSPVLFRRTALTGELCEPEPGAKPADLLKLRELVNITDSAWPLAVGWLVAAAMPEIPHPIALLGGEEGSGKSTAGGLLMQLIDPSVAIRRSPPKDEETWAMSASGSWGVLVDNVSKIPEWWSECLCRCSTGDAWVRRKLYTDSELAVLQIKRPIMLTSIDPGALRGDLGSRLVMLDLEPIEKADRKTERQLNRDYAEAKPLLFGALCSAISATLKRLQDPPPANLERMGDFGHVLDALDKACPELTEAQAFQSFVGQRERIAGSVVEADTVGNAIVALMDGRDTWYGSAEDLRNDLMPDDEKMARYFPKNAQGMAGKLKRLKPALEATGILVEQGQESNRHKRRYVRLTHRAEPQHDGLSDAAADDRSTWEREALL